MGVSYFSNKILNKLFISSFYYDNNIYDYKLYLPPFVGNYKTQIIDYFGNRLYKFKPCLDVTKKMLLII